MTGASSRTWLTRVFLALGGAGLFGMVAVDFASVAGRRLGLQVLGAIEIIQLCVVVAVGSAIVVATLGGSHAAVHLLVTRVGPAWRDGLERFSEAMTALVFALLCAGGVWVLIDLWPGDERSDLLHLPFAPARIFWIFALALSGLFSLVSLFGAPARGTPEFEAAADV